MERSDGELRELVENRQWSWRVETIEGDERDDGELKQLMVR